MHVADEEEIPADAPQATDITPRQGNVVVAHVLGPCFWIWKLTIWLLVHNCSVKFRGILKDLKVVFVEATVTHMRPRRRIAAKCTFLH